MAHLVQSIATAFLVKFNGLHDGKRILLLIRLRNAAI